MCRMVAGGYGNSKNFQFISIGHVGGGRCDSVDLDRDDPRLRGHRGSVNPCALRIRPNYDSPKIIRTGAIPELVPADKRSRPERAHILATMRLTKMTHDLLIGIVSLIAAASLFIVGLPTKHGESPRFLQFYAAPMVYPAIVLIFLALGIAELIVWTVTMKW
jgi:hypothetical protein